MKRQSPSYGSPSMFNVSTTEDVQCRSRSLALLLDMSTADQEKQLFFDILQTC